MGIFGPKRVKFVKLGLLTAIECPCGLSKTGMDYLEPLEDEFVDGTPHDNQLKCGACGIIFVAPHIKDQGRILGTGRSYEQEKRENIIRKS